MVGKRKTTRRTKKTQAKPKSRAPFTEAKAQRLGYDCADLLEADKLLDDKPNLAATLAKHPRLRKSFRRGQLLQYLRRLAPVVTSIEQASIRLRALGFDFGNGTGQNLRHFIDRDAEAATIWQEAEANASIENIEALRAAAAGGNVKAVEMLDKWYSGRQIEYRKHTDLAHLTQQKTSEILAVSTAIIREWGKVGLPRNADNTYNLYDVLRWCREHWQAQGGSKGDEPQRDAMRKVKTKRLELQVKREEGQLLDRQEVIVGLVARAEKIAGAFRYKRRELAMMLHGQTADRIEEMLGRFFDDLQRELLEVPEYLKLSKEANGKMGELLELIG